jgi:NADH-quinone oxidoreductase subunit E
VETAAPAEVETSVVHIPAEVGEDSGAGEVPAGEAAPPAKEEAIAKVAEIAARTAGDTPRADDDLKKVRGIGPKTEQLLKEMGITSYRQIAGLRDDDIVYLAAAVDAFPGRIRKDWIGSAAAAYRKKYRQPL